MELEKKTKYVTMKIKDGVFHMEYNPIELLDLDIAKEIVKDRIAFKAGNSYPSLFDIRKVNSTTKEGRDFMANEGNDLVLASSLLVSSSVTRMIGNFFMTVSRPKNPTRLFTDEQEAWDWLDQYKGISATAS